MHMLSHTSSLRGITSPPPAAHWQHGPAQPAVHLAQSIPRPILGLLLSFMCGKWNVHILERPLLLVLAALKVTKASRKPSFIEFFLLNVYALFQVKWRWNKEVSWNELRKMLTFVFPDVLRINIGIVFFLEVWWYMKRQSHSASSDSDRHCVSGRRIRQTVPHIADKNINTRNDACNHRLSSSRIFRFSCLL